MKHFSDLALIEQAVNGSDSAFRQIVVRYESVVAATVIAMLGNTSEADDVGQEVFIRFYKSMGRFRGEASLKTYLTRIAMNLSLNELKKRKKRFGFFSLDKEEVVPSQLAYSNEHESDRQAWLKEGLKKLSVEHRSILVLRMLQGYSVKETAEILGIAQGTVLSRLSRAQEKLKKELEKLQ